MRCRKNASRKYCPTPLPSTRADSSKTFYSAGQYDTVWDHFLPSDFMSIISRSDSESSLLANSPSKKSLYLALSDDPIIIDHGTKSFQLDRKSGKMCYMLAARALTIVAGDCPRQWKGPATTFLPNSRFPEMERFPEDRWLIGVGGVRWHEIRGVINTNVLSPNTQYVAYLVFKMLGAYGFHCTRVQLSVNMVGGQSSTKNVKFDDMALRRLRRMRGLPAQRGSLHGVQRPNVRSDGWLEIEMGEFFNSGLEDDELQMSVKKIKRDNLKDGLTIEGIKVRPKESNLAPKEAKLAIKVVGLD